MAGQDESIKARYAGPNHIDVLLRLLVKGPHRTPSGLPRGTDERSAGFRNWGVGPHCRPGPAGKTVRDGCAVVLGVLAAALSAEARADLFRRLATVQRAVVADPQMARWPRRKPLPGP